MFKDYQKAYYYKMLYFNGGKAIMNDNFLYFSNLIIPQTCQRIADFIAKDTENTPYISLYDPIGCCENYVLEKIAEFYQKNGVTYNIYSDKHDIKKLNAVFSPINNVFCFSLPELPKENVLNVDVSHCYYPGQDLRHNKTCAEHLDIAKDFFDKSNIYV